MGLVISSSLTLGSSDFDLSHARIGYEQLAGTTTATNEASGFPAIATNNPLTYSFWKPTSLASYLEINYGATKDVDFIGIAAHEFGSFGSSVIAEYWDGAQWVELYSFAPGTDAPIMLLFDEVLTSKVRIGVLAGGLPRVGVLYTGKALVMERPIYGGHSPIALSRRTEYSNNVSESGQWLGRSIKSQGSATKFSWDNLTAAWYRANFDKFVSVAKSAPFFIAWRPDSYPNEIGYTWTSSDIRPTNKGKRDLMSVSLSVEGLAIE